MSTYVAPYSKTELTASERDTLSAIVSTSGHVMAHRQTSHLAHSEETPITNAFSSLVYSFAYSVAGAMIGGGLLFLAYNLIGGPGEVYAILFFSLWGVCLLAALAYNRRQGLHYSPAGLDHAEIQSRERIAMFIVDRYIGLLEKKWRLD